MRDHTDENHGVRTRHRARYVGASIPANAAKSHFVRELVLRESDPRIASTVRSRRGKGGGLAGDRSLFRHA